MKRTIINILAVMLLVLGSTPALYAQTDGHATLPKLIRINDAAEWSSELFTFEEPIEGFRLTVFGTNYPSNKYNGYEFVTLAEIAITDSDGNNVAYTATTNSLAANDGGGLDALQDNNNNTYYHSAYSGNAALTPNDYVYIEITFNEPQSAFTYRQVRRSNNRDFPIYFALSHLGTEADPPFNPTNPPEPQENLYYNVSVSASPSAAAYVSGSGKYLNGKSTTINYSLRNSNYKFSHWTLNGERYSTSKSFSYKINKSDAVFVAHFSYNPVSPTEPNARYKYRLYLEANNDNACSFNITSGKEVEFDNYIEIAVYPNQGYEFQGWYEGNKLVSSSTRFNYLMPSRNVTLTAKFNYNPANPMEPNGDGTQNNVQTTLVGDVNEDGVVDIFDVVATINRCLDNEAVELGLYDVNGDGVIDIFDVVRIINISLE